MKMKIQAWLFVQKNSLDDYHDNMDAKLLSEKLLPLLERPPAIFMDNGSFHCELI